MLLEEILSKDNMTRALKRVISNQGACGIDGLTVDELRPFVKANWSSISAEILGGTYNPKAVRKVEIPKPNGGKRMLGIPTVLDRLIQQAISQKLSEIYDAEFSRNSFGFRPHRSAHQALKCAQEYLNAGFTEVVEFDLEKFFDTVNHDRLMSRLACRIADKRVLRLIRKYLTAGIMEDGKVSRRDEGTPQGSPLSPILSNIVLDELDKELESRGHKFVRYADDLSVYVRSKKAADRVKESVSKFIEGKLKLKVNQAKSKISRPSKSSLLGFSFYKIKNEWLIRINGKSYRKFKDRVRQITSRKLPISLSERLVRLNKLLQGWITYFRIGKVQSRLKELDSWIRFRLRMCMWKMWKRVRTRNANLERLGLSHHQAYMFSNTRKSYCRTAHSPILQTTLTNKYFADLGCLSLEKTYLKWQI